MTVDEKLQLIIGDLIEAGITAEQAIGSFEKKYFTAALRRTGGNVTAASALLGVHRNTVHARLRDYRFGDLSSEHRSLIRTAREAQQQAKKVRAQMRGSRRPR